MKPEVKTAIREVLEAWETPDSPEAMTFAMYHLKRVFRAAMERETPKRRKNPGIPKK